jgi:hypothetical protein
VPARVPSTASFEATPLEPLAFLFAKYVKIPTLGYPMLDEFAGHLRLTARGTMEEAIERAANLVRYGDRGQLFILLGGAAVAGCFSRDKARMNGWMTSRRRDKSFLSVCP